jgi:hypothetical protein
MTLALIAYLIPLVLGIGISFIMNNAQTSLRKQIIISLLLWGVLSAVLIITKLITDPAIPISYLKLCGMMVFILSFGILIGAGVYLLKKWLSSNTIQLVMGLLVGLMAGSVFYINPIIELVKDNLVIRQLVIKWAIIINPVLVMASNFFGQDILRGRQLYSLCDIGPFYPYNYPSWISLSLGYLVISLVFIGLRWMLSRNKPSGCKVTE